MSQAAPEINYLAKDYASFRRLMLERLAMLQPGGMENQPADLQVALVELLAYTADRLSYYQDAVATEAYLGTARSRVSLRRHARLLGYRVHEGCNARVWISCRVDGKEEVEVSPDWRFLTGGADPVVFEPCHYPKLYPQHNDPIELYSGENEFTLPRGATGATLTGPLKLTPGDLLLLESLGAEGETPLHVVRLTGADPAANNRVKVTWSSEDELPFDLPVRRNGKSAAQARANILLADHGETVVPESVMGAPRWRLSARPVTYVDPLPSDWRNPGQVISSAAGALRRDARSALPAIKELVNGEGSWTPCLDLLACSKVDTAFVVETEHDGSAFLRFGDGLWYGRRPSDPSFQARYRVGNGRAGNVGAAAICRVVNSNDGKDVPVVKPVSNPLPACGGEDPEPAEQVRLFAPQAFRKQLRAINADDYAARASSFPGVQRAAADIRWTGSWYTVYLFIDPKKGTTTDAQFNRGLRAHLDGYRLANYDIEIRGATYVGFTIVFSIECRAGSAPGAVMAALKKALSDYFHPDKWTFGRPLYLSQFYRAVLAVPGVATVDVKDFERVDKPGTAARDLGMIEIGPHEILTSKIGQPQQDALQLTIKGSV